MGKRELKLKHKDIDYSVIDILHTIDTTGKMVPFLVKQIKKVVNTAKTKKITKRRSQRDAIVKDIKTDSALDRVLVDSLIHGFIGKSNVNVLNRFTDHLENKRIDNPDITQYDDWESVVRAVTNADIKLIEKELESSVKKVIDTDSWLMVRPLTFEASLKYGANTKWCTASRDNKSYFYSYSEHGPLIYVINKSNGLRYGVCNRPNHDGISAWDERDNHIDTLTINLPTDLFMVLVAELKDKPNSKYFSDEELKFYTSEEKKMSLEAIMPPPMFNNLNINNETEVYDEDYANAIIDEDMEDEDMGQETMMDNGGMDDYSEPMGYSEQSDNG